MSEISLTHFQDKQVRREVVDGVVYFVLADVLAAIESSVPVTRAIASIEEDLGKGFTISQPLETVGGIQNVLMISESALTFLIARSRTELGKRFNRWIHNEVLPAIRKTGQYSINPQPEPQPQPQQVLPPVRDTIDYINAARTVQTMPEGYLKQILGYMLVEELDLKRTLKALPVAEKPKKYTICTVRARELGYSETQIGNGSQLGKFVRTLVQPAFKEREGRYDIWHYEVNDEFDAAIHKFFS